MKDEKPIDYSQFKTNREKRMTPKKHGSWCSSCDQAIVSAGKKCPICRNVKGIYKRLKKEKI